MAFKTRVTEILDIRYPLLSAPMAFVSGGKLASEVTKAGGLGFIAGGYADDRQWLERELKLAKQTPIGIGFITWSLSKPENQSLLDLVLTWNPKPKAIFLSFGDIRPFVSKIKKASIVLICQVQSITEAKEVEKLGADIVVAQGTEAGGHGCSTRSTFPLVPAIVDAVKIPVLAAGGIGDGRGLAAAFMLGASGVVVGTRFYAAKESLAPESAKQRAIKTNGDNTIRSNVIDVARKREWPSPYNFRTMNTPFIQKWQGKEKDPALKEEIKSEFKELTSKDSGELVVVGEVVEMIKSTENAQDIVKIVIQEAEALLTKKEHWDRRSKM